MQILAPSALPARDQRDLLRTIAEGTAGSVGDAFLRSLSRCLAAAFAADVAYVAETEDRDPPTRARILACWPGAEILPEGYEYDLADTPCEAIGQCEVISYPTGTVGRFPRDGFLARHGLEGYLAVPMHGAAGRLVGYVCVLSRARLDAGEEELAVLRIFAARAAAELERRRHEAALRAREVEVTASRTRLLHAADEERRRIGRDLHDGAQQRLVVLGQCLDLALRAAQRSPEEAARLIAAAREHASLAGRELRELSRGLHPAGLNAHGLGSALRSLGLNSPVPLRIEAVPDQRLPAPVEVTVYYLVAEALSNAVKHAGATEVRVDLQRRGPVLHAEIADDGAGGAQAGAAGTGLPGLVDRLEALGGRLDVESAPGAGTRLRASIPLAPWRDGREPFIEFGYEGDGGQGERSIAQILEGRKTVSVSLAREWDLEGGPPKIGQRIPITDHHGDRRALVEVTRVAVLPFGQIDGAVVSAETAGGASLDEWMASHRAFYAGCRDEVALLLGEPGWRLTDAEPMVVTSFRLR
ncbi:MAG TPA: histidine kinase [Solirubrobacteraceae bacterium]|nr:histidine kinase [Solirubrobacteraceae bacterium]